MLRKILYSALATLLAVLVQTGRVDAWGAYHAGYTHVGPSGVYHAGGTVARGGYGGYGGYGGGYHAGYTREGPGGAYHTGTSVGPYGGVHTGTTAVGPGGNVYHSGYNYSPAYSGTAYGGVRVGNPYAGYGYVR